MTESGKALRGIRSYVRRGSRITSAQRRALRECWPRYGIDAAGAPLVFTEVFGRDAPVVLEIGFGNGEALIAEASAHPQCNYLGIEVHRSGVGALLRQLAERELSHVRVIVADAHDVLRDSISDASLSAVHLYFPDPWPKKRHHKRRLVRPEFAALLARKLAPGGYWHLATDWSEYADYMNTVLNGTEGLTDASDTELYRARLAARRSTRFERRGRALGHVVRDLVYRRPE